MVEAICLEIRQRANYLIEDIQTIYFGGGTPSILSDKELIHILTTIRECFDVSTAAEITLEANPEDLTFEKSEQILMAGVTRLSVGVQTFSEDRLKWMNRNHTSSQTSWALRNVRKAGFKNISLDLIYAVPGMDDNEWQEDIKRTIELNPDHISLYGLTIEENTVFGKWRKQKKITELLEDKAAEQYICCIRTLQEAGYNQYEVSNFSAEGFESQHNSAYWSGAPYLGVGPGAHSYTGTSRQFNVRNNAQYIELVNRGTQHYKLETLTDVQRMNESILTRLRTVKGLSLTTFQMAFGIDLLNEKKQVIKDLRKQDLLNIDDDFISLTLSGFLVADEISLRLFFDE